MTETRWFFKDHATEERFRSDPELSQHLQPGYEHAIDPLQIFPVLRVRGYAKTTDIVEEAGIGPDVDLADALPVSYPFSDQTEIYLVELQSKVQDFMSPYLLRKVGLTPEDALSFAIDNVKLLKPFRDLDDSGTVHTLFFRRSPDELSLRNASSFLFDQEFWIQRAEQSGSPLIAWAIYQWNVQFMTLMDPSSLDGIKSKIEEIFEDELESGDDDLISPEVLMWTGDGWQTV